VITYGLMSSPTTEARPVGRRVKALREAMDLSLRDLSERSGVSAQMLSQVERGETSPTIATAGRIAGGLNLSLSQLLRLDEGEGVSVVREGERRDGGAGAYGHSFEVLTPALPGQRYELSLHLLAPAAATAGPGDIPLHEAGSRETAVVDEGKLRLVCNSEVYDLDEGDSVTFDADLPHHFENPGEGDCRFYAVVSSGLRRA
jgi:transcriptional regulator with XRE-family HTH domain